MVLTRFLFYSCKDSSFSLAFFILPSPFNSLISFIFRSFSLSIGRLPRPFAWLHCAFYRDKNCEPKISGWTVSERKRKLSAYGMATKKSIAPKLNKQIVYVFRLPLFRFASLAHFFPVSFSY